MARGTSTRSIDSNLQILRSKFKTLYASPKRKSSYSYQNRESDARTTGIYATTSLDVASCSAHDSQRDSRWSSNTPMCPRLFLCMSDCRTSSKFRRTVAEGQSCLLRLSVYTSTHFSPLLIFTFALRPQIGIIRENISAAHDEACQAIGRAR